VPSLSVYVGIDVACALGRRLPICVVSAGRPLMPLMIPKHLATLLPRGLGNKEIAAVAPFRDAASGVVSTIKRIVFEMGWQIERVAVDAPAAPPATSSRASENELAHLRLSSFRTPPASAWAGIREQCTNHLDSGGSPATLPHANKIWMLYGFELFHTPAGRSQARSSSERRRNFSRQAILLVHSPIRPRRGQDGIPIESPNPLLFARNLGPLDRFKVCRRSVCVA
jgi:hypothetical protein